jgi:hypothetical protein
MADHPLGFAHLAADQRAFSQPTADTAWHEFFLRVFLQVPPSRPAVEAGCGGPLSIWNVWDIYLFWHKS